MIGAHVVGSHGYHAGFETAFPAVHLTLEDIEEAYRDADVTFVHSMAKRDDKSFRENHQGIVVVIARC